MAPLVLPRQALMDLLAMDEVIQAMEGAFREVAGGRAQAPVRQALALPAGGNYLVMPSALGSSGVMGTKLVSVFLENAARGLPTISACYVLSDARTGSVLAILDGSYLTGIRTAAVSALASRYLARPDSRVLGLFGAGVQGRFHLWALGTIFRFEQILVADRVWEKARAFAEVAGREFGLPVGPADGTALLEAADILVTATTSARPLFDGRALRPGTHINAVGAYTPGTREVDSATVARAAVFVDTYEGAMAEAGDLLIPMAEGTFRRDQIRAELAEVVSGRRPGRTSPDEITLFKSVGFAIEDLAAAELAYRKARANGIGIPFDLEGAPVPAPPPAG